MGIFGLGKEEDNQMVTNPTNEEVVKDVVSGISQDSIKQEVGDIPMNSDIEEEVLQKATDGAKKVLDTHEGVTKGMSTRTKFILASLVISSLVAGCTRKSDDKQEEILKNPNNQAEYIPRDPSLGFQNIPPEPTEAIKWEEREVYVKEPTRLNTNEFIIGAEGYPTAIVDRSPFAVDENGEPLFLRYTGGSFDIVTYLHYTGQKPPVAGEIIPLLYKIPEDVADQEIGIVPFAIAVPGDLESMNLNDGKDHYVVPIVTSGTSSGIAKRIVNGENGKVLTPNDRFLIKPDKETGNHIGYLSWAVLTKIGNELIVEGVSTFNKIYLDPSQEVPMELLLSNFN